MAAWSLTFAAALAGGVAALVAARLQRPFDGLVTTGEVEPRAFSIAETQAQIDGVLRGYAAALRDGDADAYVAHFADDCLSLPAHGPIVRGKPALRAAMVETFAKLRFVATHTSALDTRFDDVSAYETGTYAFAVTPRGSDREHVLAGRYVIVWRRVGDQWKIALDAAQPGAPSH